jgi:hypothetical protein
MGKDDWPEGTEGGALIEEAYRKGWLPRDATSKPQAARNRTARKAAPIRPKPKEDHE